MPDVKSHCLEKQVTAFIFFFKNGFKKPETPIKL